MSELHRLRAEKHQAIDYVRRILTSTEGRNRTPYEEEQLQQGMTLAERATVAYMAEDHKLSDIAAQRVAQERQFGNMFATPSTPARNSNTTGQALADAIAQVRSNDRPIVEVPLERSIGEGSIGGGAGVPIQMLPFASTLRAKSVVLGIPGLRTVDMTSDQARFPRIGGNTAVGGAEATTIATNDASLALVTMNAVKFTVMTYLSRELEEDLSADALQVFGDNQIEALARQLDYQFLEGVGGGPGLVGIRNIAGVGSTALAAAPTDFDKISDILYTARNANANPTTFVMAERSWTALSKIKTGLASDKTTLLQPSPQQAGMTLLGLPVATSTQITLVEGGATSGSWIAAVDGTQLVVGVRQVARTDVSRDFKFDTDQIALRSTCRYAFQALNPEGISLLTDVR